LPDLAIKTFVQASFISISSFAETGNRRQLGVHIDESDQSQGNRGGKQPGPFYMRQIDNFQKEAFKSSIYGVAFNKYQSEDDVFAVVGGRYVLETIQSELTRGHNCETPQNGWNKSSISIFG
jgi:hypothetical protein